MGYMLGAKEKNRGQRKIRGYTISNRGRKILEDSPCTKPLRVSQGRYDMGESMLRENYFQKGQRKSRNPTCGETHSLKKLRKGKNNNATSHGTTQR
jgi:hypothetical protein